MVLNIIFIFSNVFLPSEIGRYELQDLKIAMGDFGLIDPHTRLPSAPIHQLTTESNPSHNRELASYITKRYVIDILVADQRFIDLSLRLIDHVQFSFRATIKVVGLRCCLSVKMLLRCEDASEVHFSASEV